jgi:hypothetical protein
VPVCPRLPFYFSFARVPNPKFNSSTFAIGTLSDYLRPQANQQYNRPGQTKISSARQGPTCSPTKSEPHERITSVLSVSLTLHSSTTVTARKPLNTPKGRRSLWLNLSQTQTSNQWVGTNNDTTLAVGLKDEF